MLGRAPPPSVIRLTPDQVASSTAFGQHRTLANFFGGRAVPCLAVKSRKGTKGAKSEGGKKDTKGDDDNGERAFQFAMHVGRALGAVGP